MPYLYPPIFKFLNTNQQKVYQPFGNLKLFSDLCNYEKDNYYYTRTSVHDNHDNG